MKERFKHFSLLYLPVVGWTNIKWYNSNGLVPNTITIYLLENMFSYHLPSRHRWSWLSTLLFYCLNCYSFLGRYLTILQLRSPRFGFRIFPYLWRFPTQGYIAQSYTSSWERKRQFQSHCSWRLHRVNAAD